MAEELASTSPPAARATIVSVWLPAGAVQKLQVGADAVGQSEFAGGDGQIGLHGTDAPWSIGQSVSHGCVRVPNDIVTLLARSLPLGTPVTIA